jgi:hypothetical protein
VWWTFRIFACGCGQSLGCLDILHRAINPVVLRDPRQVPLHHLGDRVFVVAIHLLELWHRHLEQVVIHGILGVGGEGRYG